MSTIEDFAATHRAQPWPGPRFAETRPIPSTELYNDVYLPWCEATGSTPLPKDGRTSFGSELTRVAPWVTRTRGTGGFLYHGLTAQTRTERARHDTMYGTGPLQPCLHDEERRRLFQEHCDRLHDGRTYNCECDTAGLWGKVDAATEARSDIDQWTEAWFGPYLRWQDGDPEPHDPRCLISPEEHARVNERARRLWTPEFMAALAAAPEVEDGLPDQSDQTSDQSGLW